MLKCPRGYGNGWVDPNMLQVRLQYAVVLQSWGMRVRGAGGPAVRQHEGLGDTESKRHHVSNQA